MDTLLTLIIALGGIATGIGAIWTAMLTRRQARVTEQNLREQLSSFREQNERAREQNERARLALEVDMLLKFFERFQGKGLSLSETRRSAAKHIEDNFFVGEEDLLEVNYLNKAGEDVLNFFELMGLMVQTAAIDEWLVRELFSFRLVRYWELCKPAVENARQEDRSPDLWVNFEKLAHRMINLAREDGGMIAEGFTKKQLREFVEEEAVAGFEDSKEA